MLADVVQHSAWLCDRSALWIIQTVGHFYRVWRLSGYTPIGVRAFGPTTKTSEIPKPLEKPQPKKIGKLPEKFVSNAKFYECIVGDCFLNVNGHVYRKEIWESMFRGMPYHGPYVAYSDTYDPYLRLDHVVGHIVSYSFLDGGKVKVKMEVMETPQAKIFRELVSQVPQFVTPVGECSSLPFHQTGRDGVIPDDYKLKFFNVTNDSAFLCATPLRPVEERVLYAEADQNRTTPIR